MLRRKPPEGSRAFSGSNRQAAVPYVVVVVVGWFSPTSARMRPTFNGTGISASWKAWPASARRRSETWMPLRPLAASPKATGARPASQDPQRARVPPKERDEQGMQPAPSPSATGRRQKNSVRTDCFHPLACKHTSRAQCHIQRKEGNQGL
jgi:hypothetical protein